MVVGVDRPREIAMAGRRTIALPRNALTRRELRSRAFASRVIREARAG